MDEEPDFTVVAIGVWMYDGAVPCRIEMLSLPAAFASSRYIEDEETWEYVIDQSVPVPDTEDGNIYYVGGTSRGEFLSARDAMTWADIQPWGPVEWTFLSTGLPNHVWERRN